MKKVLIIGITGGLAQILAKILSETNQYEIIGVDSRKIPDLEGIRNLRTEQIRFKRGSFESLFRENEFHIVYHLARMSVSYNSSSDIVKRLELSVLGTNKILELSLEYKVEKFVLLSTYHVYGALPDNPVFLKEDEPLRASLKYSELRDVVEMDQIAQSFMWRHQEDISTVILRPCNIIGKKINNTMTKFLRSSLALRPVDYNPMFQFIHEYDMAQVLFAAITGLQTGIYNVATNDYISIRDAVKISSRMSIPFTMFTAHPINKFLKAFNLDIPSYFIDYLKYSCLVDNTKLKKELDKDFFRFQIEDTLHLIK